MRLAPQVSSSIREQHAGVASRVHDRGVSPYVRRAFLHLHRRHDQRGRDGPIKGDAMPVEHDRFTLAQFTSPSRSFEQWARTHRILGMGLHKGKASSMSSRDIRSSTSYADIRRRGHGIRLKPYTSYTLYVPSSTLGLEIWPVPLRAAACLRVRGRISLGEREHIGVRAVSPRRYASFGAALP